MGRIGQTPNALGNERITVTARQAETPSLTDRGVEWGVQPEETTHRALTPPPPPPPRKIRFSRPRTIEYHNVQITHPTAASIWFDHTQHKIALWYPEQPCTLRINRDHPVSIIINVSNPKLFKNPHCNPVHEPVFLQKYCICGNDHIYNNCTIALYLHYNSSVFLNGFHHTLYLEQ